MMIIITLYEPWVDQLLLQNNRISHVLFASAHVYYDS